ncbi:tRNA 5-methoxyuridine(34)/uridine 5-oxyacetic acid(34) synthase CmoB [Pelagicoccus enzymogenes]|uniref:tRNA 5-methoxyuridine(34)/uridine 5-oxyacetic acid(34) synthase CmoB n=1 Tax=Pelagicoccus enzymogenes TaxID=2773457 RepID=UPI00281083C5|nr:tRNA 5-methoxyuridine(34)/uridine 5-oxyacetic acid(34) synthase CmoB [Pelagicoccus enzymogenes]MDQ8199609.1 tRNA 5-methoxyuridine(34)/uridine 5-oxyacetic acid(34) synthase CmoB [Pelagicoccus enzymogenes]
MQPPLSTYEDLYKLLADTDLEPWIEPLRQTVEPAILQSNNGHLDKWLNAIDSLPDVGACSSRDLASSPAIQIGRPQDLDTAQRAALPDTLHNFRPWRKGPFDFFGTHVDTEWRSDLKWDRLIGGISDLTDRLVLDIGCGSGYHCWRMAGAGAKLALGTDPFLLYVMQYLAARKYLQEPPVWVLPFGIEGLPPALPAFDTVFSMGILYHRRSPFDHLYELRNFLRPGGELVLETIVVDGPKGYSLVPDQYYAKMKNVWFIPTVETLVQWVTRCRYRDIQVIDVSTTTTEEQRGTEWMVFESFSDFLDPKDPTKTIEGHPAPKRAVITAKAP